MKRKLPLILLAVLLVLVMATCFACNEGDDGPTNYTVTLDLQNGTEPTTQTVQPGGTVNFPELESDPMFIGWFADAAGTTPWDKASIVTANVTIYACWKAGYTVTLDLQNGTEPTTQIVAPNGTVNFPEVPNEEYKTFRAWYKNPECTIPWLKTTKVTSDVTIYAGWNVSYGVITFNLNYTGCEKPTTSRVECGTLATFIEPPARPYWNFLCWCTDAETTKPFDFSTVITDDVTLYAKWVLEDGHIHSYETETTPATCTKDGFDTNTCGCGDTYTDNVVPMLGHKFNVSDTDYFGMVECENGCTAAMRKESERIYDDVFKFTCDEERKASIDKLLADMTALLENADKYDATLHTYTDISQKNSPLWEENKAFETNYFDKFYDELMYLIEQYQYAYVFYCVNSNEANTAIYEDISEYRTNMVNEFYALYGIIYETKFREFFYDKVEGGWSDEDIQEALALSASYGGDAYAEINNRISEIEVEFREIEDPAEGTEMTTLYEEFVSLQNQLAQLTGYENYVEYAYANVYGRDYTPEDTAIMRNYVKAYLKDVYVSILNGYKMASKVTLESGTEEDKVYTAIMNDSIFQSKTATDLVKEYFIEMTSAAGDAGEKEIDFYKHANDLFKNGNYYTGKYQGAFSYWIGAQDASILYFGPGSYSGAFTFVHEFGHYYNNIYNPGLSLSYDLDETHSQANELMFLTYLEQELPKEILRKMYSKVYYDTLFNMFAIVMLATAVDEFEYCVYTYTNPDGTPHKPDSEGNGTPYTPSEYTGLFSSIMNPYGIKGSLNDAYWRYVVIEAPCYYISYAMSALPCVELLSVAELEGFDSAKSKYLKFFTFTDDPANTEIDEYGDKVVTATYAEVLKYVGLHSVFEEGMYSYIKEYFVGNPKDFTYPDAE